MEAVAFWRWALGSLKLNSGFYSDNRQDLPRKEQIRTVLPSHPHCWPAQFQLDLLRFFNLVAYRNHWTNLSIWIFWNMYLAPMNVVIEIEYAKTNRRTPFKIIGRIKELQTNHQQHFWGRKVWYIRPKIKERYQRRSIEISMFSIWLSRHGGATHRQYTVVNLRQSRLLLVNSNAGPVVMEIGNLQYGRTLIEEQKSERAMW